MDVAGHWIASITSPMGPIEVLFDLEQAGETITGSASARGDTLKLYDGRIDGDTAQFKIDITSPMKLTMSATVTVNGDTMSGKAKPGALPGSKLSATRQR